MDYVLCHRLCEEQPESGRDFVFVRGNKLFRGKAVEKTNEGIYRLVLFYTSSDTTVCFFDYGKDVVWAYVDELHEHLSKWMNEGEDW